MSNEIVTTLKGNGPTAPWVVFHAEDAETLDHQLDSVSGDLFAKIHGLNEIFQNVQAAAPLAPSPSVQQSSSAAQQPQPATQPPATAAWQPPEVPRYQPPAASAPQAPTGASGEGLPAGVSIWSAPSSKNAQYTSVYFSYPFIGDAAARKALQEKFKDKGWAKPFNTESKPWIFEAAKSTFTEADARGIFNEFAGAFG